MAEPGPHDYKADALERVEAHQRLCRHDIDVRVVFRVISAGDSDIYHEGTRRGLILYLAEDGQPCTAIEVGPDTYIIRSGW